MNSQDSPSGDVNARQVLINLAASATLADHMGDMWDYINEALEQVGIVPPDEAHEEGELGKWLAKNHNATTVYGTTLGDE